MLNLTSFLDASAFREPEKTAVIHENKRYSYAQLRNMADKAARGPARCGLRSGRQDRRLLLQPARISRALLRCFAHRCRVGDPGYDPEGPRR